MDPVETTLKVISTPPVMFAATVCEVINFNFMMSKEMDLPNSGSLPTKPPGTYWQQGWDMLWK